jgi:hypothetical protein
LSQIKAPHDGISPTHKHAKGNDDRGLDLAALKKRKSKGAYGEEQLEEMMQ